MTAARSSYIVLTEVQFETYQVEPNVESHGYSGPLGVSSGGIYGNVGEDFMHVASQYDKQRGFTNDVNGLVTGSNEYGVSSSECTTITT